MSLQVAVTIPDLSAGRHISRLGYQARVKARLGWKGLKTEEYVDDGYIFLSTPNLKGIAIDFENVNYITEERYRESPEIMLREGDVLLAKDGATLGIVSVVRHLPAPATVNGSIAVIRPRASLDSRFLFYVIGSAYIQSIIQQVKGGMGVPHLFQSDLRRFPVFFPRVGLQRAIADFLDRKTAAIDELVRRKERLIELLQEKRQAFITQAVTKGLDPTVPMKDSGVPWLREIPAHWEVTLVKYIARSVTSGSRAWSEYFSDEGALFLQSGNLDRRLGLDLRQTQFVNPPRSAEGTRTRVSRGDVLLCITGALTGNVGVVEQDLPEAYVNQHLALIRPLPCGVGSLFLACALASRAGAAHFRMAQYGGTKQGLSLSDVRDAVVAHPPMEEQGAIEEALRSAFSVVASSASLLSAQLEWIREYRQALISAAVTGQIDVSEEAAA